MQLKALAQCSRAACQGARHAGDGGPGSPPPEDLDVTPLLAYRSRAAKVCQDIGRSAV